MSFSDVFAIIEQDDLSLRLYSKTAADVEQALIAPQGNLESLMTLLSPAAAPFIETMAAESVRLTRQRFGNNLGLYLPLYLSNLCANECDYCGFTMSNKIKRKTLNEAELRSEIGIIKARGFDSILLVSGEHETKVGMDYFSWVIPIVKAHFSYLAIEVQPLSETDYARMKELGVDAVMVYQETYRPITYAKHHTRGQKKDFQHRLTTADRAAKAGIDKIGLGVLLGLDDWRLDALIMGHHIDYLEKKYWRTRYSISLPRLRPCTGGVNPKVPLTDLGLVQLICAFRLFNPQLEISLSTRETEQLRDNLLPLGVTHLSAGSSTQPGGYQAPHTQLDQFEISDARSVELVVAQIQQQGFTPVWKDWEAGWS
ncbi:2-iminoacetate synthase ThiH [Shewanella sp. SR44-3]|uniref:2-iminoacetate synthase ThiH n=1 Tax=unclassified Shewanella TaxID=196818 RepID=UPI0015FA5585|nr:2-iminoacetate synthase ThiH [Shewanella sp. SR44-3]MBB1270443.1 2-iminoacetate synthase ThiH [Shewanella sp. SR44-3]